MMIDIPQKMDVKKISIVSLALALTVTLPTVIFIHNYHLRQMDLGHQIETAFYSNLGDGQLFNFAPNDLSITQKAPVNITPIEWHTITFSHGDSLSKIFLRLHIPPAQLRQISKLKISKSYLPHIKANEAIALKLDDRNNLIALKYEKDTDTLLISKINNAYRAEVIKAPMNISVLYKGGVVHRSLAESIHQTGISYGMYKQLVSIFKNQINLTRNAHTGDHFSVLYDEYFLNGKKNHAGDIVAAEYTSGNKTYKAIRFAYGKHPAAYYSPEGHPLDAKEQSLFLSAPLHYRRISGIFTYRRMDPYMHFIHPHLGIDYAAPIGTPIRSMGDGKISYYGNRNGYGKTIMVKYGTKYEALYAHLLKFSHHIHLHSHVARGEVIGYLGSTGWSTGPHLHFEMHVYGVPRDPLKLRYPTFMPIIPHPYLPRFYANSHTLLAQLKLHDQPEFADNQNSKAADKTANNE